MRKAILAVALVGLGVCTAYAGVMVQPQAIPVRVANSEVVFVGKVTEIEPLDVEAKTSPDAKEAIKYHVAVVKISQTIRGLKDEKTLRVGFVATAQPPGKIIRPGIRSPKVEVGQEGLFMLNKHHEGNFYLAPAYGFFISTQQKTYEDDLKTVNKAVDILKDVKAGLQSKDADDRLIAAAMQIGKYRTQKPPFPNKEEPIDAAESKLIMKALATAKWEASAVGQLNPQRLFYQLGVHPEDGWKPPQKANAEELRQAIQEWIKSNAESFRIKRYVAAEKAK